MKAFKKKSIEFQGNYKSDKYFEGWYYKQVCADCNSMISFIPGISLYDKDSHSFVQYIYKTIDPNGKDKVITGYCRYSIKEFSYTDNPFCVKIGDNTFTDKYLSVNLKDSICDIQGTLAFGEFTPIKQTFLMPDIMGIFSYIPWMECYHGLISMKHRVDGSLNIVINSKRNDFICDNVKPDNNEALKGIINEHAENIENKSKLDDQINDENGDIKNIENVKNKSGVSENDSNESEKREIDSLLSFDCGSGYIEKDWGRSFPKRYIWMQCNHFHNETVSIVFSLADIPFIGTEFEGFLCNFCIDGEEFRFATYTRSKFKLKEISSEGFIAELEKRSASLIIKASANSHGELIAPDLGSMNKKIREELSGKVHIVFCNKKTGKIYEGDGIVAGIEMVGYSNSVN